VSQPLDGVMLKIQRADEHIRNLNAEVAALINGDTYRLVSEPDTDARECVLRVLGPEPPGRLAVIAGEIVHQLRSILDHLVWQLVIANGGEPSRKHQFPIHDRPQEFRTACERGVIKGISASARSMIEAHQPYKRGGTIERNFLHVLREMDNTDKHRSLTVLLALASIRELSIGRRNPRSGEKGESIELVRMSPPAGLIRPTERGAEVQRLTFSRPEPDVQVTGKPIVQIAFGDLGALSEQSVIDIVSQLRNKVLGVVEEFRAEFAA
jgi:hypothetical protein